MTCPTCHADLYEIMGNRCWSCGPSANVNAQIQSTKGGPKVWVLFRQAPHDQRVEVGETVRYAGKTCRVLAVREVQ